MEMKLYRKLTICLTLAMSTKCSPWNEMLKRENDIPGKFYQDVCEAERCSHIKFLIEKNSLSQNQDGKINSLQICKKLCQWSTVSLLFLKD